MWKLWTLLTNCLTNGKKHKKNNNNVNSHSVYTIPSIGLRTNNSKNNNNNNHNNASTTNHPVHAYNLNTNTNGISVYAGASSSVKDTNFGDALTVPDGAYRSIKNPNFGDALTHSHNADNNPYSLPHHTNANILQYHTSTMPVSSSLPPIHLRNRHKVNKSAVTAVSGASPAMETPNLIRVKLTKQPHSGFGFTVRKSEAAEDVIVSRVMRGGMAERSGLVRRGDTVVMVNQQSVSGLSVEQTIAMMDAVQTGGIIDLLLRGPPSCTTYLKTTFLPDGRSKWVRVTEPHSKRDATMSPSSRRRSDCETLRNGTDENASSPHDSPARVGSPLIHLNSEPMGGHSNYTDSPTKHGYRVDSPRYDGYNDSPSRQIYSDGYNDSPSRVNGHTYNDTGNRILHHSRDGKKGIEIWQNEEEITVILKGDVHVKSDRDENDNTQSKRDDKIENDINKKCEENNIDGNKENKSDDTSSEQTDADKSNTESQVKFIKLKNIIDGKTIVDNWHNMTNEPVLCNADRCLGSIMNLPFAPSRSKEEVVRHATEFINKYYSSIKRSDTPSHQKRLVEVLENIERDGLYELTSNELTFGAKDAWRNAPRCIGRIQWSKLQVFDARHIRSASGMFEAICNHIRYATNNGNLRSAITIFPVKTSDKTAYRVWNSQLIKYAGYQQTDGKIIGDPANAEFTQVCINLGWRPRHGMFDVLPLVLSANGQDPEMFEIPGDLILEVNLTHPTHEWFGEMGLKWYSLPAVSGMMFDCGGLQFTACPFSGWYMETEIGSRDLLDTFRYNLLEPIAQGMGLDTNSNMNLWKDKVNLEMNIAVLHSYRKAGVTIVDHHSTSDSFIKHMENEQVKRGGCPADWVWVIPPMSGSLTKVFHQEMAMYVVKPSYEYQEDAWKTHVWKSDVPTSNRPRRKLSFKQLASAVQFSSKLMSKALARRCKCTILYATETGKSEGYSRTLNEIFKYAFDSRVVCMEDYDVADLEHETLVLILTSTFGNGDPPDNGQEFARGLFELHTSQNTPETDTASISSAIDGELMVIRESEIIHKPVIIRDQGTYNLTFAYRHPLTANLELVPGGAVAWRISHSNQTFFGRNMPSMTAVNAFRVEKPVRTMRSIRSVFSLYLSAPGTTPAVTPDTTSDPTPNTSTEGSTNGTSTDTDNDKHKREMPLSYVRQSIASRPITPMRLDSRDQTQKDMLNSESDLLANVRYAVFALGSTAYPNFCAFGHYMDKMMYELGGDRIYDLTEGDELSNEEESFRTWAKDVFKAACETFCVADSHILKEATSALSDTDLSWSASKYRLVSQEDEPEQDLCAGLSYLHKRKIYQLQLTDKTNLQTCQSNNRQTLLMKFDLLSQPELSYKPGDHVGLYPDNDKANVDYIISRLLDAPPIEQVVRIEILNETTTIFGSKFTWEPCKKFPLFTIRRMLTNFLDITTPPSPMLLQLLATQATDPTEQEKIDTLAKSPELYNSWKQKRFPNIADVLRQFPSIQVPPTLLITHLPLLQQRYYSISSSLEFCPNQIHTTVSLVEYTLPDYPKIVHHGVASLFFQELKPSAFIPGFIRKASNFRMPSDNTLPLILVAAGCGIAPLRSFWQQRQCDVEKLPVPMRGGTRGWGEISLYFGCRRDDTDNIYKKEVTDLRRKGIIAECNLALSRDESMPKTYVQHLLIKNAANVYKNLFKRGGHFYVCGDVSMAAGVSEALEQIVAEVGGVNWEEAKVWVIKLREDNRFHEDIFGVTPKVAKESIQTIAHQAIKHYTPPTSNQLLARAPTPENQIRRLSWSTDV